MEKQDTNDKKRIACEKQWNHRSRTVNCLDGLFIVMVNRWTSHLVFKHSLSNSWINMQGSIVFRFFKFKAKKGVLFFKLDIGLSCEVGGGINEVSWDLLPRVLNAIDGRLDWANPLVVPQGKYCWELTWHISGFLHKLERNCYIGSGSLRHHTEGFPRKGNPSNREILGDVKSLGSHPP